MKKFLTVVFFLSLMLITSLPAAAVADPVRYVGGTVPELTADTTGRLDTTSATELIFEHSGKTFAIPYGSIASFDCSKQVARHLGVLPAIAVGIVRMRQHRHFFRISYHDGNGLEQVAIFEVPKQLPRTLEAALETRTHAPHKTCDGATN